MRPDGRLFLAVVACTLFTCHAPAPRPEGVAEAEAPRAKPPAGRFDPAAAAPSDAVAEVRRALDAGDPAKAARGADRALADADAADRPRLAWLRAQASLDAGDRDGAATRLAALADSSHPLAPWAALRLAELLEPTDPEAAARRAEPLVGLDWAGRKRARLVRARSLAAAGHPDQAIPELRALVEAAPDSVGAASAGMPLAELLAARADDPEAREEALALYRRVATRAPLARIGELAAARAEEVLRTLPADRRRTLAELPVDDALARAHALYGAMHHQEAEEAFAALAKRLTDDPAHRCEAELYQGKAMLRQRERDEGAALLTKVAERCTGQTVRARAHFLAARARSRRGDNAEAIALYAAVEQDAPDGRLADDALFRAALAAGDDGNLDGMVQRLEALPSKYPNGDMRPRARFMLAWRARADGRFDGALDQLDRLLREGTGEDREGEHGRAAYWRARTLQDAGRADEAAAAYAALVRTWPLSYYGQQAATRLAAVDPKRAKEARSRFAPSSKADEALTFPHRAELDTATWKRALELLRVGEVDLAVAELAHLGALGAGADDDLLWLVAAVLDHAGAYPEASRLVRTRLGSFRHTVPAGRARRLWRLAYPHAFAPLIERVADEMGVPASYLRAVAREESAFDPGAVSVAHARGLIQLMGPTARRFARSLGLRADAASLHDPQVNLRIGGKFIAYLFGRYPDNPAVVPAAYNAGEHAADRWIRAEPEAPFDQWVEDIPYDETRRYTRRVLETWGIYRYLDEGNLPALPEHLPHLD